MSKPKLDYSNLIHGINGQKRGKEGNNKYNSFSVQNGNGRALGYRGDYKGDYRVFDATHPNLIETDKYLKSKNRASEEDLEL